MNNFFQRRGPARPGPRIPRIGDLGDNSESIGGSSEEQNGSTNGTKAVSSSPQIGRARLQIYQHEHIDGSRSRRLKRTVHKAEEPYIPRADYGKVPINADWVKLVAGDKYTAEGGQIILTYKDQTEHIGVSGGSGSGKTYSALNQIFEGYFRGSHIPDGPEREELKSAVLVIEAKGDFRDKTWYLAQRYGRMDDCYFFGPEHATVIDLFGDPTETPLQKANKLVAMSNAFKRGQSSQDPFWEQAAQKLYLHFFLLHDYVSHYAATLTAPEEKKKFEIPPMSFHYLNLLLLDKGKPLNQEELAGYKELAQKAWGNAINHLEKTRAALGNMMLALSRIDHHLRTIEEDYNELKAKTEQTQRTLGNIGVEHGQNDPDEAQERLALTLQTQARRQAEFEKAIAMIRYRILGKVTGAHQFETESEDDSEVKVASVMSVMGEHENFRRVCEETDLAISNFLSQVGSLQEEAWPTTATAAQRPGLWLEKANVISLFEWLDQNYGTSLAGPALALISLRKDVFASAGMIKQLSEQRIQPETGALRQILDKYEQITAQKHKERYGDQVPFSRLDDSIVAYFVGEYLNVANDKAAGSVAMVASTMISMLIHPPFDRMFNVGATLNFANLIDRGQILYLDIPTAQSAIAQEVASVAIKIDFFRNTLLRERLPARDASGHLVDRLVNQKRFVFYFSDEFGSIATTGNSTGEADVMDKVRQFGCGFVLGYQSWSVLRKRLNESEIKAIMTNVRTTFALANTDLETNDYMSKLFGETYKANATLNRGAMSSVFTPTQLGERDHTTSFSMVSAVEPSKFAMLDKGECYVVVPQRYKNQSRLKVQLKGHPVAEPTLKQGKESVSCSCPFPGKLGTVLLD